MRIKSQNKRKLKTGTWTAERIKSLRLSFALTQADMAEKIGVSQQLIQRLESGRHEIGPMTAIALDRIEQHLKSGAVAR